MQHAARAITAPEVGKLPLYWQFHDAVARAQLAAWLPRRRHLIVDVSGPRPPGAELLTRRRCLRGCLGRYRGRLKPDHSRVWESLCRQDVRAVLAVTE